MFGKNFADKFDKNIDPTYIGGSKNYLKLLLDIDQVRIGKEIEILMDWVPIVLKKDNIQDLISPLEALIMISLTLTNYIIQNNLYLSAIKEEFATKEKFIKKTS